MIPSLPALAPNSRAQEMLKTVSPRLPLREQIELVATSLEQIEVEATQTPQQQLCQTTRAISARLLSQAGRAALGRAALETLAQGTAASPGGFLAALGVRALSQESELPLAEQGKVGGQLLGQVECLKDLSNHLLPRIDNTVTQVHLCKAMLEGLQQASATSIGGLLAGLGVAALSSVPAEQSQNRALTGSEFLKELGLKGDSEQQQVSQVVLGAMRLSDTPQARSAVAEVALNALARNHSPLLELGLNAIHSLPQQDARNRSAVGLRFLESLQTTYPQLQEARGRCLALTDYPARAEFLESTLAGLVTHAEGLPSELEAAPTASAAGDQALILKEKLTAGETFSSFTPEKFVASGKDPNEQAARTKQIESLIRFEMPATEEDADCLKKVLDAVPSTLLGELEKAKFTLTVCRDRISIAHRKLANKMENGQLKDMGDGAVVIEQGQPPRILVRSHWKRGQIRLEPAVVLREIARALDQRKVLSNALADSYKSESNGLPKAARASLEDFSCELFARYKLDPARFSRQFPLAHTALEKAGWGKHVFDSKSLATRQRAPRPQANLSGDPFSEMQHLEELAQIQRAKGLPPIPYRFEIAGDPEHNLADLCSALGDELRHLRHPEVPLWAPGEAAVTIPAAVFNQPADLEKLLNEQVQSGRGALLVLNELSGIQVDSPGFQTLARYQERFGGLTPLLLQGSRSDLDRLREALPTAVTRRFSSAPLTAAMVTELVAHKALAEGYQLSQEARVALQARARDGELAEMLALWNAIKSTQTERASHLLPWLQQQPSAVRHVLKSDVENAPSSGQRDPIQELERMIGLANAKKELRAVMGQIRLQKQQQEAGLKAEPPRLNLLFEGNPGTGKTTVAKLFAEALTRIGYLKNNKFKEVRIQDLLAGRKPQENVKKLFEQNKGGVIFIDEMHQLKDTPEGRLAFRAMIPYLGHPDYADTVFIGAGYKGELRDLIRDVDDGAERRFTGVDFQDYSKEELGQILDKMAIDKHRTMDQETREAALLRLERERRKMKNFGNAGTVATVLGLAVKKQSRRLTEAGPNPTREALMKMLPEDFAAKPVLTPAQVWKEIDALEGLDSAKKQLRSLCASIEYDRQQGIDPLTNFEPYFILDGPPGTGKTTLARLLVKLMAAYDIIPSDDLVETQGAHLQAGFVGQTTSKVKKLFERMWGQGGFIDEVSGLARAPEAFQTDASKTMLKQMEDFRGRFILVVADYAERVNEFLNIDPGLARRFGHRFSLEPLSPEAAQESLCRKLEAKGLVILPEVRKLLCQRVLELSQAPKWASNGDVRKALNTVLMRQKTTIIRARREGRQLDRKVLLAEAVDSAFARLLKEKNSRKRALPWPLMNPSR